MAEAESLLAAFVPIAIAKAAVRRCISVAHLLPPAMNICHLTRLSALAVGSLLLTLSSGAADWNQWRGPTRDGIARDFKAPAAWSPSALAKKWTVPVGEGHSSPVVVGDRVYVFARENDQEIMRCLSLADGKVLWQDAYAVPYEMNFAARGHGKGPKSTPAVVDGRVFAHGINGHLSAYDAKTGKVLWRHDFKGQFKSTTATFGSSASPLVDGTHVILHVGGEGSGALTAFDVATGKVNWKWAGDGPGYASPVLATIGGVRQLITQSEKHCVAVSPVDGKVLWQVPFSTPYDQNIITPVVAGDLVIFGGVQKPTFALKVGAGEPKQVWDNNEVTMYMSSPVLNGTTLYGMSNKHRGMLFALNTATGVVSWKGEGRLGENASLTDVGSALLVLADSGDLTVHQKSAVGLKEIAKYKVADAPVWASPAVAGDWIVVKDKTKVVAFQVTGGR